MLLLLLSACLMTETEYQDLLVRSGDADGDGHASSAWDFGDDCDDTDPTVHPSAVELAYNGKDDDCLAETPDDDLDADGFGVLDDCDDEDPRRHPGAVEVWYDGSDQDCDGNDTDADSDGHAWVGIGGDDCDDQDDSVQMLQWYPDIDGDSFGDSTQPVPSCEQPPNLIKLDGDCDDSNASIHPGQPEICENDVDDNCDDNANECAFESGVPIRELLSASVESSSDIGRDLYGVNIHPLRIDEGQAAMVVATDEGCLAVLERPDVSFHFGYFCKNEGFGTAMAHLPGDGLETSESLVVSGPEDSILILKHSGFAGLEETGTLPIAGSLMPDLASTEIFAHGGNTGVAVSVLNTTLAKAWLYSGSSDIREDWVMSWHDPVDAPNEHSVTTGDWDGDGLSDLSLSVMGATESVTQLFSSIETGHSASGSDADSTLTWNGALAAETFLADTNGDGWSDLVVVHAGSFGGASVFLGPLLEPSDTPGGQILGSLELPVEATATLHDLDGDGGSSLILGLPDLEADGASGGIAAFVLPIQGTLDASDALWILPDDLDGARTGSALATIPQDNGELPLLAISSLGDADSTGEVLLLKGHGL